MLREARPPDMPEPPPLPPGRLPRRELGRGVLALLVLLRVYVLLAIPLVGYAFIRALHAH